MENFNQEYKDEVEFLSKNDPKGNKEGRRTGKFVPIDEAPDLTVSPEEEIIEKIDKGEKIRETNAKDFYEREIEREKLSEEEDKKAEELAKKMSRKIKTLTKKGVAHIGPDVKVAKQPIEDLAEHSDIEVAGKKMKSRTLSKFGKFFPGFLSKRKRLTAILPNDFISLRKGDNRRIYGSINKKEENLKTEIPRKTERRLRGETREKVLHNPEVWDEEKVRLNPEDLMNE